jgi:hypothetical protein
MHRENEIAVPPVPRGLCGVGGCVFIKGHDQHALTGGTHSWEVRS